MIFSATSQQFSVANLKDTFELLVKNQLLMRNIPFDTAAEDITQPNYHLPEINIQAINNSLQGNPKLTAKSDDDPGDKNIYWKVNFDRFIQHLR